jgi:hypothetical protein
MHHHAAQHSNQTATQLHRVSAKAPPGCLLPWLTYFYDPFRINERCSKLVPSVRKLVRGIIEEHRVSQSKNLSDNADFVDVLLSLEGEEKHLQKKNLQTIKSDL